MTRAGRCCGPWPRHTNRRMASRTEHGRHWKCWIHGRFEGPPVNAHRYLIRLFKGGIDNWLDETVGPDQLTKSLFDVTEPEQSVYEVANGVAAKLREPL